MMVPQHSSVCRSERPVWRFNPWGIYAAQWQALSGLMVYGTLIGFSYMMQVQERAQLEERLRMEASASPVRF